MTVSTNQSHYAGSISPIAPGQPGTGGVAAATPDTRAGITAGTTPTSYEDATPTSASTYLEPASSSSLAAAPTDADWMALGASEADLEVIHSSGMSATELNAVYAEMSTGETAADAPDASTTSTAAPATTSSDAPATPGWSDAYARQYTDVMTAAGMSPEGVDVMVEQLASDPSLTAADLDAGLEFYASPEGATQLGEIDSQLHAGVPISAYVPLIGMALGAGTVAAGVGVGAYKVGDRAIDRGATRLMERAAAGDARAANAISTGKGGPAASRAATMSGNGAKAAQMSDRARASLQMLYERKGGMAVPSGSSISSSVDDMLKHGFDAKGNPTGTLAKLADQKGVTKLAGESVESFAVRVAGKHGVHIKAPAAGNFISGAATEPHFNNGGGTAYRPYATDVKTGTGWAAKRAAADRMGSILHPVERARLVAEANKVGPAATAIRDSAARGGTKLGGAGSAFAAEITARSTGAATLSGGLKGVGSAGLKSFGSKMGIAGVGLGLAMESGLVPGMDGKDTIAGQIKEHGFVSKESGNAIGGSTGRVVGGVGGFAVGSALGSAAGAALVGATIGSAVPVAGTLIGGAVGLAVGLAVSYGASKALGAAGEHIGDGISKVNEFADRQNERIEDLGEKAEDKLEKVVGKPIANAATEAAEVGAKIVTNPVGAAKDVAEGAKNLGGKAVGGIKKLFGGD